MYLNFFFFIYCGRFGVSCIRFTSRVPTTLSSRLSENVKEACSSLTSDVFVYPDKYGKSDSGLFVAIPLLVAFAFVLIHMILYSPWLNCVLFFWSLHRNPGYGLTLVAESTSGALYAADVCSASTSSDSLSSASTSGRVSTKKHTVPEDLAAVCQSMLFEEILQVVGFFSSSRSLLTVIRESTMCLFCLDREVLWILVISSFPSCSWHCVLRMRRK